MELWEIENWVNEVVAEAETAYNRKDLNKLHEMKNYAFFPPESYTRQMALAFKKLAYRRIRPLYDRLSDEILTDDI